MNREFRLDQMKIQRAIVPRLVALLFIAALSGCGGENSVMSSSDPTPLRALPVQPDPSFGVSEDSEARLQQERDVVEQILDRVPSGSRAQFAALLADRSNQPSGTTDPLLQPLLAKLAAIRSAIYLEDRKSADEADRMRGGGIERVRVTIALVPKLSKVGARAAILRQPNDGGVPLLLLPESSATAQDVERGLYAAAVAAQQYGRDISKVVTLTLRARGSAPPTETKESMQRLLSLIRDANVREIQGYGHVRAIDVMARAPTPPSGQKR